MKIRKKRTVALPAAGAVAVVALLVSVSIRGAGPQRPQPRAFSTVPALPREPYFPGASGPAVVFGRNVNVTNESGPQSETSVAVDPTNPKHILESVNDLTSTAAVYESTDGGQTWTNSNLTTNGSFCYDTWLDFNAQGDAFVSFECSDQRIANKLAVTNTWAPLSSPTPAAFRPATW